MKLGRRNDSGTGSTMKIKQPIIYSEQTTINSGQAKVDRLGQTGFDGLLTQKQNVSYWENQMKKKVQYNLWKDTAVKK